MTKFIKIILLSIVFALSANVIFGQNCQIVAEKGCGKIAIGASKAEIESVLGLGETDKITSSVSYKSQGLVLKFEETTNRVKSILFVIDPKVWGETNFSPFGGSLPNKLSTRTNPAELTQTLGKPLEQQDFGSDDAKVTMTNYQGIEYGFRGGKLMYIEVTQAAGTVSNPDSQPAIEKEKVDSAQNNVIPTQQTPPRTPVVAKKVGTFTDCKIILSEGCRNYFFQTPIGEISNELGIKARYDKDISMDLYVGDGIRLIVDPTTGRISSLTIDEYNKRGWKPNDKVKWEAKWEKVKKEFGEGNSFNDGIHYQSFTVNFNFSKLHSVTFFGPKESPEEDSAYLNRRRTDIKEENEREREAEKAANTPEAIERKKQQMETDYRELLNQLDAKNEEGMRIVNSERLAIAAGGMFKAAVQKKIDRVTAAGDSLIKSFGEKYKGMIPAWMIKGIQEKWRPIQ